MANVSFTRRTSAPIDIVWSVLEDHRSISRWTAARAVELEREGDSEPNGVGAIRAIRVLGPPLREQVTEFVRPTRLAYRMLSGAPVKDYEGATDLTATDNGTEITWQVDFKPRLPGVEFVVRRTIHMMITSLVKESERRSR